MSLKIGGLWNKFRGQKQFEEIHNRLSKLHYELAEKRF